MSNVIVIDTRQDDEKQLLREIASLAIWVLQVSSPQRRVDQVTSDL
jgi:hypothetical protein